MPPGRSPALTSSAAPFERPPQNLARLRRAVERAQLAPPDLPALRRALELPAVCADAVDAKAFRGAMAGERRRLGARIGRENLQIGGDYRAIAVDVDARQACVMREPLRDRGLVLVALDDRADRRVAARSLAAAEVGDGVA